MCRCTKLCAGVVLSMRAHQLDNFRRRKEELWRHRNLGAMPHSARFVGNLYKVSYFDATCDAHTSPNESPRRSESTSESRSESRSESTSQTRSESKSESRSESSDATPNVTNVTVRRRRRPVAISWRHLSRCGIVACVLVLVVALGLVGLADAGDVGDGGAGANGQASGSLGAAFGVGVAVVARSAGAYDQPAAETQNLAAALVAGHASVSSANAPVGAAVQRGRSTAAAAAALLQYLQSAGQSDNLVSVDMLLSESGGAQGPDAAGDAQQPHWFVDGGFGGLPRKSQLEKLHAVRGGCLECKEAKRLAGGKGKSNYCEALHRPFFFPPKKRKSGAANRKAKKQRIDGTMVGQSVLV